MIIRKGNKWDFPFICDMLRHYRENTPWDKISTCDNEEHIRKLLSFMLVNGIILVAEKDDEMIGMLLAIKNTNIWDPNIYVINELAYWVESEHRGSSAGYRLIKEYCNICNEMIENKQIESYTISKMVNSPDLKYDKFGFKKEDERWRI